MRVVRVSNYDKFPVVGVPGGDHDACQGWPEVAARMRRALTEAGATKRSPLSSSTMAIECYVGVFEDEIRRSLSGDFPDARWISSREAMLDPADIDRLIADDLAAGDPLFGRISSLELDRFFSVEKIDALRGLMAGVTGPIVVIGPGATLIAPRATLVIYADLPRWETQQRQRRGQISNLGSANRGLKPALQYKRSFFVDWPVCDRLKRRTMGNWDFILDTCIPGEPKLVGGDVFRRALSHCASRPFRVVPYFDPGPWGGQWMKQVCDLDPRVPNFAWCFDCVPEENSLLLQFGSVRLEVPSIDLVFAQPEALLGAPVRSRFGSEFPIRFDLLDTMGGGNLSLQVHPSVEYIQSHFGMRYTQDESYYLLDAKEGATVCLGRRNDAGFEQMMAALAAAQSTGQGFDDHRYIGRFAAHKHDHFLIPAGTIHCSGRDCMVLEISATPYLFTFKLWDWGRLGLDGEPRPINLERGRENIRWERDEDYVNERLINQFTLVAEGDGWREERTGLHGSQFIETRRHWFTGAVPHDTGGAQAGSVNVLNLVEGEEVSVESPSAAFEPFVVHYAETFIVPAAVGPYLIQPHGRAQGTRCATIKASVRCLT